MPNTHQVGNWRQQLVARVAAASAVVLLAGALVGLMTTAPADRDGRVLAGGGSTGPFESTSESASDKPLETVEAGGWEEHRPTDTSPDNQRPAIPPGHNRPTTTTSPGTSTTIVRPTTTSTTTSIPPLGPPPSGTSATRPSDLVPQFTVLDAFPAPAYVGPLDPAHPNQRPWDDAIVDHGATRGYARTWTATSGPGGYTVYAFEFPDASSAQGAAADAMASFVEDFGAAPFFVREGVSGALVVADCARAYWTQGRFLRIVDVSTQSPRDVVPAQAQADVRTIVNALLAL